VVIQGKHPAHIQTYSAYGRLMASLNIDDMAVLESTAIAVRETLQHAIVLQISVFSGVFSYACLSAPCDTSGVRNTPRRPHSIATVGRDITSLIDFCMQSYLFREASNPAQAKNIGYHRATLWILSRFCGR
jgi:hypothetical protein